MNSRRLLMMSGAGLALLAGCLALAFALSSRFHLRLDLSEGRLYSLSPGSKRLLKDLEESVTVKAYFSKELPPQFAAVRSYARDLLQEYRIAAKGKLTFEFVDLAKGEEAREEALREGISPIQFNVVSKEKYEVQEGFMGLVLGRGENREVIPVVSETESLEYELSSRIVRLVRRSRRAVGFVSSAGARGTASVHPRLREVIERNYELRDIDLDSLGPGATVPADVSALILLGASSRLGDAALFALEQFLLSGRPLALGVDLKRVDLQSFASSDLDTGLRGWLESYGIRFKNNLVLDLQSQKVSVQQRRGWFTLTNIIDYPPMVVATDLSRANPVTRDLPSLSLPFVSPMELGTPPGQAEFEVLARSSRASWIRSAWAKGGFHSVSPMQPFVPTEGDPKGPFVLAAVLEGELSGRLTPPKGVKPEALLTGSRGRSRLLVVGTSRFSDPNLPPVESGPVFLQNMIDWLCLDPDLISIRSKGVVFRPLRELAPVLKTAVRWTNILGPALLVAAFGFLRLLRRRSLRRRRLAEYTPQPQAGD